MKQARMPSSALRLCLCLWFWSRGVWVARKLANNKGRNCSDRINKQLEYHGIILLFAIHTSLQVAGLIFHRKSVFYMAIFRHFHAVYIECTNVRKCMFSYFLSLCESGQADRLTSK